MASISFLPLNLKLCAAVLAQLRAQLRHAGLEMLMFSLNYGKMCL